MLHSEGEKFLESYASLKDGRLPVAPFELQFPLFTYYGHPPFVMERLETFARRAEMRKPAKEPNDLEKIFVECANAGDVEGLVALYEADAKLACGDGVEVVGTRQIRRFFTNYLTTRPKLNRSVQAPALCNGNIALTSSRHSNGDVSVEIARRQPDGSWLWIVDQFAIGKDTQ